MDKQQRKILDEAIKTKLQNEKVLTGGSKYINPIRKKYMVNKDGKKKK